MRSQQLCQQFIKSIMSNKNAGPFNEPVDFIALGVPEYPQIIANPMDFGTIEQRLSAGEYSSVDQLASDCRLVFSNARTFNPPDHIIYKMATDLSKFFERKFETLRGKLDSNELGNSVGLGKEWVRGCKRILKAVQDHEESYPFLQPVDWRKLGIPDYPKIIKKPMDLSKVERKLSSGNYSQESFVDDMNLIFENAKTFNLEVSQIYQMAQNVQSSFHQKCAELLGTRQSKRKHQDTAQDIGSQKRQMNHQLGQLQSDDVGAMVDMVKQKCPDCISQVEDDKIEIDIDQLSAADLGDIAKFVSSCIASY